MKAANNKFQINRKWTVIELSVKEYADLTGRSERSVREHCLHGDIQNDPEARIRIRIGTCDLMEEIHDVKGIKGGRCK